MILRGHSTTTWTEFCHLGQFLHPKVVKNRYFLTPSPPHLVHVVIEWPLTGWQTFWLIKCRKIMVMAGMHLYKQKGKKALDTVSNQVPFSNMNVTTLFLLSTKLLV